MQPMRPGMLMPQLPGATSSLLPGTPSIGKFLKDQGYTMGQFGKNHFGEIIQKMKDTKTTSHMGS